MALVLALVGALAACGRATEPSRPPVSRDAATLQLVESFPLETALDHADVPDAKDVWVHMIDGARATLDVAEFYLSDDPRASKASPSALGRVVEAIERAAARGVRVRVLVDASFLPKYPELPDRLRGVPGIEVRAIDGAKAFGGGILHAKYFVVDGTSAYLGSQNFDYRSLEHIHELGVRTTDAGVVGGLLRTFARDYAFAGGASTPEPALPHREEPRPTITFAASPRGALPDGIAWDLPLLVAELRGARREICVAMLTYKAKMRDGSEFTDLDAELRAAKKRGVRVRLVVGAWRATDPSVLSLRDAGVEVHAVDVPRWSGGDIPFARVVHAKYLVVDGERAWLGTSNWEGDYFLKSRNVGLFVRDSAFADRLRRIFEDTVTRLREATPDGGAP
jgi:phosphatidylserine/phosphatidylglycerophosphate/cardiolipin synthase-like enzyme